MSARLKIERFIRDPLGFLSDAQTLRKLKPQLESAYSTLRQRPSGSEPSKLFQLEAHSDLSRTARGRYLYLPWVRGHGDALITSIDPALELVCAWPLFGSPERKLRGSINRFVLDHPAVYRKVLLRALAPLRDVVAGMLFTLDWNPPMRQAVYACRELGIPTVLVPHEAVFADRERYYVDRITGADYPLCDVALCWGELQREIFLERGYAPERLRVVGSPKLDEAAHYAPQLTSPLFAQLHGLSSERAIVLFALQPLDSQLDSESALRAQNQAVADALATCATLNAQLLVRAPPSGHDVLLPSLKAELMRSRHAALDDGSPYLTSAAEALYHCACVLSLNSTMLLEGALMGRAALSMRYLDFPALWAGAGIAGVHNRTELEAQLTKALSGGYGLSSEGRAWAARRFSSGSFDNGSRARIRESLEQLKALGHPQKTAPYDHMFTDRLGAPCYGTAAFYRTPTAAMAHVEAMLGFRRLLLAPAVQEAQTAEVFVKWGITPSPQKDAQDDLARQLNRPQLIIEDGFLRGRDIGLSGEAGLSIIVDTQTAYYDATRPSRLEQRLNGAVELSAEQLARATACMEAIRTHRLSKYNHAPDTREAYGQGPCVLVVDQRLGDQSVESGLADERSFERMLQEALSDRPGHTVLIKRHPDATRGGKGSYFDEARLARYRPNRRLVLIDGEVNPHTLFDQVDEVFVVTSGMGMEALIAGRKVRCYGVPFYAGWGATEDRVAAPRRSRQRSTAELFHFAYIESSRYFSPRDGRAGELEDVIDALGRRAPT